MFLPVRQESLLLFFLPWWHFGIFIEQEGFYLHSLTGVREAHTQLLAVSLCAFCMKHFFPHALSHSPIEYAIVYATATQNVLKMDYLIVLRFIVRICLSFQKSCAIKWRKKHFPVSNCWLNNRKKVGFLSEGGFTCHLLLRQCKLRCIVSLYTIKFKMFVTNHSNRILCSEIFNHFFCCCVTSCCFFSLTCTFPFSLAYSACVLLLKYWQIFLLILNPLHFVLCIALLESRVSSHLTVNSCIILLIFSSLLASIFGIQSAVYEINSFLYCECSSEPDTPPAAQKSLTLFEMWFFCSVVKLCGRNSLFAH